MVMWQPASSGCVVRNLNGDTAGGAELPNRKIRPYPSPVALPCDVLVIGAALLDVHARSRANVVHGTSNPARMMSTPGGVGRNIAENLARLGTRVSLVALVGPDDAGDRVLRETAEAGVDVSLVMTGPEPTGTYLAVLDRDGELVIALSDLTGTEGLTPERLSAVASAIEEAPYVVVDGNLPQRVVAWILERAASGGARVVLDPVSVPKAALLAPVVAQGHPIAVVTPNVDELGPLSGGDADPLRWLHDHGVQTVWTRLGARGSQLSSTGGRVEIVGHPVNAIDVTGAGDSMTAGLVSALLAGAELATAAAYGQAVAELTVASPHTVRPDLTDALVRARLAETHRGRADERIHTEG